MTDRKTPSIPDVQGIEPVVARILQPMRELLHRLTGRSGGQIARLNGTATTQEIQNKLNEVIDRMNG
jgi:hypothetical protein